MPKRTRQAKRRSRKNRKNRWSFLFRFVNRLIHGKKFLKKNFLTIFGLMITILASYFIYRLSYDVPDLRIVKHLAQAQLDFDVDEKGNITDLRSYKFIVKNMSFKSGYIDKVEFTPNTLSKAYTINLVSIDKEPIAWRQEKVVELTVSITINKDLEAQILQVSEDRQITIDGRLYDNTGKLISTSLQGSHE